MEKVDDQGKLPESNDKTRLISREWRTNIIAIIMMAVSLPIWIYGGSVFVRYFIGADLSLLQKISYILAIYVSTYIYLMVGMVVISSSSIIIKFIGGFLFFSPAIIFYISIFIMGIHGIFTAVLYSTEGSDSGLIYEISVWVKLIVSDALDNFGRVFLWTPIIGVGSFMIAVILFKIRKYKKMMYGSAEVLFGVISIVYSSAAVIDNISPGDFIRIFYDYSTIINQPWKGQMFIQFFGGIYIIIRGMDNIDKAFEEKISSKSIIKGEIICDLYDLWAALFHEKNVLYAGENEVKSNPENDEDNIIKPITDPSVNNKTYTGSQISEIESRARSSL